MLNESEKGDFWNNYNDDDDKNEGRLIWTLIYCVLVLIGIFVFCFCVSDAKAEVIPDEVAVYCIIGEAENQGYDGMLALAHALKNRGTVKGVYGCHATRVRNRLYSTKTLVMADRAWQEAKTGQDCTLDATGWGNKQDLMEFRRHKWFKKCEITVKVGDHYFYKCDK